MPKNADPSTTQQDDTYAELRPWITLGRVVPGERLKIRDVAAALGVGLMPVRAALQRLAAEGALTHSPNRGVAVPQPSRRRNKRVVPAEVSAKVTPPATARYGFCCDEIREPFVGVEIVRDVAAASATPAASAAARAASRTGSTALRVIVPPFPEMREQQAARNFPEMRKPSIRQSDGY